MKPITMSRTLTEIKVKYVRPVAATRTWEEISDRLFSTDGKSKTMSRTLTEIKVKYVRPVAATRTWEEISDRLFITEDTDAATKENVAAVLGLPSADYVDDLSARRVKATWLMSDIVKKAKLTEAADDDFTPPTKENVAAVLGLPSADYVDGYSARRVKAVWNLAEIIKKAKLTEAAAKDEEAAE